MISLFKELFSFTKGSGACSLYYLQLLLEVKNHAYLHTNKRTEVHAPCWHLFDALVKITKLFRPECSLHIKPLEQTLLYCVKLNYLQDLRAKSCGHFAYFRMMCSIFQHPIYPDPESEKAIMGSVVYCIHHKEGCQWSDELRKLKAHLNTCKHDAVLCAAQCGAMIPRVLMQDHLRYTCSRRRANCEYCGKEFSGSALEEHQGNCGHEPVYCENKCGAKVQRRHTQQHMQQHCSKRLVPCRHCSQRYTQDTVSAHGATCARAPVPCPQRCAAASVPRDELDTHLRDHCAAAGMACAFRDAGCRFKGTRQALDRHTEDSCQQHLALVSALATRQARQLDTLRAAVARLSINCSGALVWRITDWAAKMAEAKCKDGVELISPAFYTSQYGYKLQASLFLNGNGAGEATHMSVYIKILPGEYDALLRWPFAHTVSFTLFDQSSSPERACNIVESFVPDPSWKNFQRPSREPDALGFGFPRFVSHEMLKKRNFVKDDVMFLRVKVDPSKIVAV
ncbi:TNF receptor-associated factor 4 isoform X1 [Plutella xylostella]|uniref:TNF receptor-associated factor 4 isoform X1 n=1 Tax=Plutella xylostella TaxID=51655 RepID=UPI002032CDF8|nr:TNF receptor-associated factor 4 isoform X1 [Plutella xylostella]